jgi:hypothetical protein
MSEYPYYSAQILSDSVFTMYGGQTGSSTSAQRQAAYLIAEQKMTEHLSAFLVPTIITGTVFWKGGTLFETEYGYVRNILHVQARTITQTNPITEKIYTGSALVRNPQYGYLDVLFPTYYCVSYGYGSLYENQVVYESGLATGTSSSPTMLAALTMAAQIYLNMWVQDLSNEGVADIGIQSFSNQGYSENRTKLLRTVFGSSAIAQQIAGMTKHLRAKPTTVLRA